MTQQGIFFEILARDQERLRAFYEAVFGWSLQTPDPDGGFAYVTLPSPVVVRGGVGQAEPGTAGWEPGTYFYIMVEDIDAMRDTLDRVVDHGGAKVLEPTSADGYTFAMFNDPEGNTLGVVLPFPDGDPQ